MRMAASAIAIWSIAIVHISEGPRYNIESMIISYLLELRDTG
jgi:hypothetical protein